MHKYIVGVIVKTFDQSTKIILKKYYNDYSLALLKLKELSFKYNNKNRYAILVYENSSNR